MKRGIYPSVLLAALAAAQVAFPQPASSSRTDDGLSGAAQQIDQIQTSEGINSPDLIEPLMRAGLSFREQGHVALAIAAFERARHLVRVNYGLSSFKEAPLLRQLVQIEEARGNAAAAWELEQELLGMIRQNPGPVAAPMLREIADKRVDVLERYVAGEFPPQIKLGCYYAGWPRRDAATETQAPSCSSGSSWSVKQGLYNEATRYYYRVMQMIWASEGQCSDKVPELYMGVLRASYAARSREAKRNHDYGTESQGRGMLLALYERYVKCSSPMPVQMNALLQMADWDLLFAGGRKENEAAFQAYEALYERLQREGLEQSLIDEMFSPDVPVVLPAFSPNPLVSSVAPGSSGYIDVAFEITKYGRGKSVEFLDSSTNATEVARKRVRDLVDRGRFRPRVANGAFEDPSRVVVRHYVND